jgi:hypothetical protein
LARKQRFVVGIALSGDARQRDVDLPVAAHKSFRPMIG